MRLPPPILSRVDADTSDTDLLICFSHLRWNFVYQRPQHLLSRAAADYIVWYWEEPLFEDGDDVPRVHIAPQPSGVVVMVPVLSRSMSEDEQATTQRALLAELLKRQKPQQVVSWYYTPMALTFSEQVRASVCVYDCMDELSAFKNAPRELTRLEQTLLKRADVVFTGGHSLYAAKRHQHENCHAFPSAVDIAHFARARKIGAAEPQDQAAIPHPRVGFFGVIDERMDLELVGDLAHRRPDLQFVLIGPVVKIDPATLPQAPNLHWLGSKDYAALPDYLSGWDCAFMPFAMNESTRFISPTKTPEFLAAGVPVCSTPITDVVRPYGSEGLVEIAGDSQRFSECLDVLLNTRTNEWLQRVDRFLENVSWDETWARMQLQIVQIGAKPSTQMLESESESEIDSLRMKDRERVERALHTTQRGSIHV
jgi:hypothetical protein